MCVSLDNLEMSTEQLDLARSQVRECAYTKWRQAGFPPNDGIGFWLEAEQEWIGRNYVPPRPFESPSANSNGRAYL
jgi:hypothetical protein